MNLRSIIQVQVTLCTISMPSSEQQLAEGSSVQLH